MRLALLVFVLLFSVSGSFSIVKAPTEKGFDFGKEQIKMLNARNKFLSKDYKGALEIYQEVFKDNPKNASAANRIGECYLALNEVEKAVEYFEKAKELDPKAFKDIHLSLGIAYHRVGKLDQALVELEKYKKTLTPKQLKSSDVEQYISQVSLAKTLIANPVDVTIKNIGESINSIYDDYAPSISADGKTMIFTSRRADTKGGKIDFEYDRKFFEDIYLSTWDETNKKWSDAEPLKGSLNTEGHDASLSISPSGNEIYVYRNIEGETKSGDIYISKLTKAGKWGTPKPLEGDINSSYFESSASISADGNTMFFVSERKGGYGNGDIYIVKKINKKEWGEPINAGPVINTVEDEISVFFHPDGKTLFFSSKGHNSIGGYDVFKSVYENGKFTIPENLGYPINTLDDDLHFILSTDNKTGYYSSYSSSGFGERDILQIDMSRYKIVGKKGEPQGPAISILKGTVYDSNAGEALEADIDIKEVGGSFSTSISSNSDGDYFITLPADKTYEVSVKKQGYKAVSEKISLVGEEDGTATMVKHFILDKSK